MALSKNRTSRLFVAAVMALATLGLAGCALPGMHQPSSDSGQDAGFEEVRLIPMTAAVAQEFSGQEPVAEGPKLDNYLPAEYRIGAYDVLDIVIWGRPELNNPGGMTETPESRGRQVRADGTIFYPFVGVVSVAGKTVEEVRAMLASGLERFLKRPQINVRVGVHQSKKFYVTGQVNQPGVHYIRSEPQSLLDVISAAGGMAEQADLSTVYLTRRGQEYKLDLTALYERGDDSQNIWVREGDTIHVPDNSYKKVFVIGEVAQQTHLPMHKGRMTLAEALTGADGVSQEFADARGVYVLRRQDGVGEEGEELLGTMAFQLNARAPDAYLVADMFELQPRDVVFVSTLPLTRWNRVLTQILPTVQTVFQTDAVINRSR